MYNYGIAYWLRMHDLQLRQLVCNIRIFFSTNIKQIYSISIDTIAQCVAGLANAIGA